MKLSHFIIGATWGAIMIATAGAAAPVVIGAALATGALAAKSNEIDERRKNKK